MNNLWIRSQDKMNLVKINQISINYANKTQIIANCLPEYYENSGNYYELLGTYKTKERALEVLDDIQNFICIEIHENNINYEEADLILKGKIVDSLCKVYQMPEN